MYTAGAIILNNTFVQNITRIPRTGVPLYIFIGGIPHVEK